MNTEKLQQQIIGLIREELELEIPSVDTDLIETGYLDSLRFIHLIAALEENFEITISLDDLDFDNFTSVENIALFMQKFNSKSKNGTQ
jgi:acyl carrier protein